MNSSESEAFMSSPFFPCISKLGNGKGGIVAFKYKERKRKRTKDSENRGCTYHSQPHNIPPPLPSPSNTPQSPLATRASIRFILSIFLICPSTHLLSFHTTNITAQHTDQQKHCLPKGAMRTPVIHRGIHTLARMRGLEGVEEGKALKGRIYVSRALARVCVCVRVKRGGDLISGNGLMHLGNCFHFLVVVVVVGLEAVQWHRKKVGIKYFNIKFIHQPPRTLVCRSIASLRVII